MSDASSPPIRRLLRLLHVEDHEGDAALIERALVRGGYELRARRVETAAEMEEALRSGEWDLVIADYSLPLFSATAALRVLHATGLDLPFIVVSGTIGEDVAVEMMRSGAHDYVMKDRLHRLLPAVERELREAALRRASANTESELRALETQYRAAFETSPDGFCVLDSDGRILEANDAFAQQSGYLKVDLRRLNLAALIAIERVTDVADRIGRVVDEGRDRFDTRLVARSGRMWDADLSISYLPLAGGRIFVFARDVTKEKETAREIRRFIAGSPAVIYALRGDDDGQRLVWVSENVVGLTGYGVPEIDDDWWLSNLHAEDRGRVLESQRAFVRGGHQTREFRFRHKRGHYVWLRDEQHMFPDPTGPGYEVIGSWVDVTARVDLEQQYRQAQKMEAVGRLAGGVAHDFNNLLTVILGFGNLMLQDDLVAGPARGNLEQICVAAERASQLTRQLLAFSRKQVLELRVADLNAIIGSLEKMLRRLIGEDIAIDTRLGADVPPVQVDPGQVEQIIINLAVNARDAMPEGGRVEIATERFVVGEDFCRVRADHRPGAYARLTIRDTGRGMTSEVKARIFEPFFTTKEVGKGTGLGLATVFGIIKQFDGTVDVWSEPDAGALFTIDLPAAATPPAETAPPRGRSSRIGSETILIVEDEESVRHVARLTLEARGYAVLTAPDGIQGLALAEKHRGRIDLVLTDVVMPGLSGRDMVKRLRVDGLASKAIFMSGYVDDAVVRLGLIDEQVPFLQKPFTPTALAQKVRDVLDAGAAPA